MSLSTAQPSQELPPPDRFWWAFGALAVISVIPLLVVRYPPMVDLPQHAGQVAYWVHYDDPAFGFKEQFEFHWFKPYLITYGLARVLAAVMPILWALKCVILLIILLTPLSFLSICRLSGTSRWFALLGFPLAYSFSFYWGFLSYMLAVPLGIWFVAYGYCYAKAPTARKGGWLALFALALFFAHMLAFMVCGGAVGLLILIHGTNFRRAVFATWPLLAQVPVVVLWMWVMRDNQTMDSGIYWSWPWHKWMNLPGILLGFAARTEEVVFGSLMLLIALSGLPRPRMNWAVWKRLTPFVYIVLLYSVFPDGMSGTALVGYRLAVFVVPLTLLAHGNELQKRMGRLTSLLTVFLTGVWMVILSFQFHAFDYRARGIDDLIAVMKPNKAVCPLVVVPHDKTVPYAPYLHFTMWYQAEKGGRQAYSFARNFPTPFQYRAEADRGETDEFVWRPDTFDWRRHGDYDYFILVADQDLGRLFFREASQPVVLRVQSGMWWLYEKLPAGTPAESRGGGD